MKKVARTARLVVVENCVGCPFSYECDNEWTCTTAEDDDGHYKTIMRTQKRRGGPWLPPPKWCPLRAEIVVVTLGEKARS